MAELKKVPFIKALLEAKVSITLSYGQDPSKAAKYGGLAISVANADVGSAQILPWIGMSGVKINALNMGQGTAGEDPLDAEKNRQDPDCNPSTPPV